MKLYKFPRYDNIWMGKMLMRETEKAAGLKYSPGGKRSGMNPLYFIQRMNSMLENPKYEQKRNLEIMRFGK